MRRVVAITEGSNCAASKNEVAKPRCGALARCGPRARTPASAARRGCRQPPVTVAVVYSVVRRIGRWGRGSHAERGPCPDRRSSPAEILEAIRRRGRRPGNRSSSLRQAGIPGPRSSIGHQDPDGRRSRGSPQGEHAPCDQNIRTSQRGVPDRWWRRHAPSIACIGCAAKRSGFPEAPGPEHRHGSWGNHHSRCGLR